ncbi:sensor histidine kinase [Luteimonas sp. SJ-92]|uniref:Sensor histidine kinase n=1 Tax=Luteimonas salinisoli TaxID=2752307 RepID=A0A853J7G7_9GAMM|nr:histidine kinase [Luteimonas salinisoli]NZA25023.1 sensor histidine kinase [Luteimonas salinisoli]
MPAALRTLLHPLNLAAVVTWLAVGLALRTESAELSRPLVWTLLGLFLAAMLGADYVRRRRWRLALHALQALAALAVIWLAPHGGTAPVLLVILVAQLAMEYPARATAVMAVLLNLAMFALLEHGGHPAAWLVVMIYSGFETFAAMTAYYMRRSDQALESLSRVNGDLLATRALLANSARDGERVRVARELHDVAGHKLTAMTLNLRALANDPQLAGREELRIAQRMSQELLGDIRGVVQSLRDSRGLDLATALHALAAPLPRPTLKLEIDGDVHIGDPALAETVLRVVQEALTNSARHADADTVCVRLSMREGALQLQVEDDGRLRGPLREGNGLAGMRERVAALGGSLAFAAGAHGALRIDASLPA